ncbi:DUF6049 family protein [Demequina sp. NBRC 110053]|uniref:DUF6049 family protein n=1 Tax=Demequina sp. NBRC 110053 TaxID=1570342 RepID=UPI0009FEF234|nr:DUF6049 family protein [Demequina sp. NBRC 110053]
MRRPLAAACAAALALVPASASVGAGPGLVGTESGSVVTGQLEGFGPEVVAPGRALSASVTVSNSAATPANDIWVELWATSQPLASADALADFLDSPHEESLRLVGQSPEVVEDETGGPGQDDSDGEPSATDQEAQEQDEEPPDPTGLTIPADSSSPVMVTAAAADLDLPADEWGIYGVVVQVRAGDEVIPVDALPFTWTGDGVPPLEVAILAQATGSPTRVESVLTASAVDGVAVAVDPTTLTNATVIDQGLVTREVLRVAAGTPDVTSLAHAGDEQILAQALAMPAGASVGGLDRAPWVSFPAAVDRSTVAFTANHGAAGAVAMPSAAGFEEAAEPGVAVVDDGSGPVLVADPTLSETLEEYRPGTPAASATLVALSALAAAASDGEPLLIAPGTGWQLGPGWQQDDGSPSASLRALVRAPWVTVVAVADLLDSAASPAELAPTLAADTDLPPSAISALGDRMESLRTLATAAERPEAALAEWADPVVRAVPQAMRDLPDARQLQVDEAIAEADATLSALRIAESSDLNLLADSGDVPITVVNDLDWAMTTTVDLSSLSPSLVVQDRPVVTVPARQELAVPVTVEAVSSGNVSVTAVLRTTSGSPLSEAQQFDVRVRADWGTAATAVFSVLLVLLLIAGLVRTIRRGRADTRTSPRPAPATAPSSVDEVDSEQTPAEQDAEGAASPTPGEARDG